MPESVSKSKSVRKIAGKKPATTQERAVAAATHRKKHSQLRAMIRALREES